MLGGLAYRRIESTVAVAAISNAFGLEVITLFTHHIAVLFHRRQAVHGGPLDHSLRRFTRPVLLCIRHRLLHDLRISVDVGAIGGALDRGTAVRPLLFLDGLARRRKWIALRVVSMGNPL